MSIRQWSLGLGILACLTFATVEQQTPLHGCAPVAHPGQWVDIDDESALIAWDSKTKTEHFVRRADFVTQAADFGFLVPTPNRPELGEVDDRVFETLGRTTAPRHVYEQKVVTEFGFGDVLARFFSSGLKSAAPHTEAMPAGKVEVLEQKEVAGFAATVLKANDARALSDWLEEHGYEVRPALTRWLQWYVENDWIMTAFKLSQNQDGHIQAKALRMSFQTDKPFYPYREPDDMRNPSGQGSRTLRVFFLSDARYEGHLGEDNAWPGFPVWANQAPGINQDIARRLKLESPGQSDSLQNLTFLTEFEDKSFPRPGTDEVYFRQSSDQSTTERPPIIHTVIVKRQWPGPWGAVVLGVLAFGAVGFACIRQLRRKRAQATNRS